MDRITYQREENHQERVDQNNRLVNPKLKTILDLNHLKTKINHQGKLDRLKVIVNQRNVHKVHQLTVVNLKIKKIKDLKVNKKIMKHKIKEKDLNKVL